MLKQSLLLAKRRKLRHEGNALPPMQCSDRMCSVVASLQHMEMMCGSSCLLVHASCRLHCSLGVYFVRAFECFRAGAAVHVPYASMSGSM